MHTACLRYFNRRYTLIICYSIIINAIILTLLHYRRTQADLDWIPVPVPRWREEIKALRGGISLSNEGKQHRLSSGWGRQAPGDGTSLDRTWHYLDLCDLYLQGDPQKGQLVNGETWKVRLEGFYWFKTSFLSQPASQCWEPRKLRSCQCGSCCCIKHSVVTRKIPCVTQCNKLYYIFAYQGQLFQMRLHCQCPK